MDSDRGASCAGVEATHQPTTTRSTMLPLTSASTMAQYPLGVVGVGEWKQQQQHQQQQQQQAIWGQEFTSTALTSGSFHLSSTVKPSVTPPSGEKTIGTALFLAKQELVASFILAIISGIVRASGQISDEFVCVVIAILSVVLFLRLDCATINPHAVIIATCQLSKAAITQLFGTLIAQFIGYTLGALAVMLSLPPDNLLLSVPILSSQIVPWAGMFMITFATILVDDACVCVLAAKTDRTRAAWLYGASLFVTAIMVFPLTRYTGSVLHLLAYMIVTCQWDNWYWYVGADAIALTIGLSLAWLGRIKRCPKTHKH